MSRSQLSACGDFTVIAVVSKLIVTKCQKCTLIRITDLAGISMHAMYTKSVAPYKRGDVLLLLNPEIVKGTQKTFPVGLVSTCLKTIRIGSTKDIGTCEFCDETINTTHSIFCVRHEKDGIESARRKRTFLSSSHVIIGLPPVQMERSGGGIVDFDASYILPDDSRVVCIQGPIVTIGKGFVKKVYGSASTVVDEEEDVREIKMRNYLAQQNDNGGKQIRAMRGIELEKSGIFCCLLVDRI
jgi:hypothetical protein